MRELAQKESAPKWSGAEKVPKQKSLHQKVVDPQMQVLTSLFKKRQQEVNLCTMGF